MTMIYGGTKGWQPTNTTPLRDPSTGTVTDYGQRLGYDSQPTLYGGGSTYNPATQNVFQSPNISRTGQPVPASFENMSVDDKQRFTNQGGRVPNERISGPLGSAPVGTMPYGGSVLPVYDQLNPQTYDNLGPVTGYDYVPYQLGSTPVLVRVPQYNIPAPVGNDVAKQQSAAFLMAMLNGGNTGNMSPGILGFQGMPAADNRAAILNELYKLDPAAWAQAVSAGAAGGNGQSGTGTGGGPEADRNIENEAIRRRNYDVQARNYARAGMPNPTILDIPRQTWNGTGTPPWGSGEAPYQQYGREVQNGFALPFDYEVGSPFYNRANQGMGGGMWGGTRPGGGNWPGMGGPRPGGGQNQSGGQPGNGADGNMGGGQSGNAPQWGGRQPNANFGPWFNQLPWWARGARQFGPALGSGMTGGA